MSDVNIYDAYNFIPAGQLHKHQAIVNMVDS